MKNLALIAYLAALAGAAWLYRLDQERKVLVDCNLARIQGTFQVSVGDILGDDEHILAYRDERVFMFARDKITDCNDWRNDDETDTRHD